MQVRSLKDRLIGRRPVEKAAKKTLYVHRPVLNADEIISWAKGQGFAVTLPASDMHVTVAYSKQPVNWQAIGDDWSARPEWALGHIDGQYGVTGRPDFDADDPPGSLRLRGGPREVVRLGDKGAVVLKVQSAALTQRWCSFMHAGASWDYCAFSPHVTITYQAPSKLDLAKINPFAGDILLDEEHWGEIDADWAEKLVEKAEPATPASGRLKVRRS
jgi:hypothetical protein